MVVLVEAVIAEIQIHSALINISDRGLNENPNPPAMLGRIE